MCVTMCSLTDSDDVIDHRTGPPFVDALFFWLNDTCVLLRPYSLI
jgi:hypothetical protein